MGSPGFWDAAAAAKSVIDAANVHKRILTSYDDVAAELEEAQILSELLSAHDDTPTLEELSQKVSALEGHLEKLEVSSFLSGPHDAANAILSLHPGAGGTESCDWASMLLRMYTRWAERSGYKVELIDYQAGDEAGISSATLRLGGEMAYGYLKCERGVHRLVRISPFDANARRHTSFCAVDVIAEIEDVPVEIKDEDLEINVARASGPGGQGVNTTDSAVQIIHKPTGITVKCMDERSQLKNKAKAMKILRARLYERAEDEKRAAMEKFYGPKGEIGWGSQIRSYVLQPYQMVKDLRTGIQTGNVPAVLDGDLDAFIKGWLKAGCPRQRMKGVVDTE
jgi:peptide chain release factor 2